MTEGLDPGTAARRGPEEAPAGGPEASGAAPLRGTGRSALAVGTGVLLSRFAGFGRDVAIGAFFGTGLAASAYHAALRIPNLLRNLLGEGTLSASFVPVYSAALREGSPGEVDRLARGVLGMVVALAGLLSAGGVLAAPLLSRLVVPGWSGEGVALTTALVRILFPMAGVMIVAAWALGILNSHRRFFLPFAAPTLWNLSQIGGLMLGWWAGWEPLVHVLAWSTLLGSLLQAGVQLPAVLRLVGTVRPSFDWSDGTVRRVARNAVPVMAGQGVYQIVGLLDLVLASVLPTAAIAGLYYAQRLAYLPLSLVGVSVATAALPEMARERTGEAVARRLRTGFLQIVYFVLPSAVALILFGDLAVSVLFERGAFSAYSTYLVSSLLAAYALGLVATSSIKLFAGGFYAFEDTATPVRLAVVGLGGGLATGAALMFWMRAGGQGAVSAAGLLLGGSLGAWLHLGLLWGFLERRTGPLLDGAGLRRVLRLVVAALLAAAVGLAVRWWLEGMLAAGTLPERAALLLGTLLAAGVSYVLAGGRPDALPKLRHDESEDHDSGRGSARDPAP